MGVCFQTIEGNGPKMDMEVRMDIDTGFVWIVCRREPPVDGIGPAKWYLQGVADYEHVAVEMCEDESYFIGPLPHNTALPRCHQEWVGSYFPLQ